MANRPSFKIPDPPWLAILVVAAVVLTVPFWFSSPIAGLALFGFAVWLATRRHNSTWDTAPPWCTFSHAKTQRRKEAACFKPAERTTSCRQRRNGLRPFNL